jgi:hypothetical protein
VLAVFGGVLLRDDAALLGSPRGDMLLQYLPWRVFGFDELARGNLALWNPHLFSGRPFLGDFQSALLYPPNLVHLVLPHRMAINVTLLLHVWLAGAFTYTWARRSSLGRKAATLAGLVASFGGPFLLHVEAGHLTHVCTMAWTPAVLLCLDEVLRRRGTAGVRESAGWILPGMAATALQLLAGHPQFVYYTALVSLALAAAHAIVPPRNTPAPSRARRAGPLLAWVCAWGGGAALAAIQVLAGLDAAGETARWQQTSRDFAGTFALPPENLGTLVAPHLFGGAGTPYFGRWFAWEVTLFVGAGTLVLAALARGRRAALEWALVLFALALALGPGLPAFGLAYDLVPGFQVFRAPARLAATVLPLVGLLAARGLEATRRAGPSARAPLVAVAAAVAVASLALVPSTPAWEALTSRMQTASLREVSAGALADRTFGAAARAATTREILVAAATLALCAALLAYARRRPAAAHGLAVVAALELVLFARAHRAVSPPLMPYPALWREAAASAGEARVRHQREWFANQGMIHGHLDLWGYDASIPARYVALVTGLDDVAAREGETAPRLAGVVSMLRWRYLFGSTPQGPPAIVTVGDPMPRVALVDEATVITDRDALLRALLDEGFDPRRRVLLETPPQPAPVSGEGPAGEVTVTASSTDTLDLDVETSRPAVLVVTDSYARGWRAVARAEGPQSSYDVLPANLALRAVPLAAGRHWLRLEYAPVAFRAGRVLSVVAIGAWLVAWAMTARRWPRL